MSMNTITLRYYIIYVNIYHNTKVLYILQFDVCIDVNEYHNIKEVDILPLDAFIEDNEY